MLVFSKYFTYTYKIMHIKNAIQKGRNNFKLLTILLSRNNHYDCKVPLSNFYFSQFYIP